MTLRAAQTYPSPVITAAQALVDGWNDPFTDFDWDGSADLLVVNGGSSADQHLTRESAVHAYGCLVAGRAGDVTRAEAILNTLAALQLPNGNWKHHLDTDPGGASANFEDANWGAFILAELVGIWLDFRSVISGAALTALNAMLDGAIGYVSTRTTNIDYTNVRAMEDYALSAAAEARGNTSAATLGRARLAEWIAYTRERSGFDEFASPIYTVRVLLPVAHRIQHDFTDASDQADRSWAYSRTWQEIGFGWDRTRRRMVGPSARLIAHDDVLREVRFRVQQGTGQSLGEATAFRMEQVCTLVSCPAPMLGYFTTDLVRRYAAIDEHRGTTRQQFWSAGVSLSAGGCVDGWLQRCPIRVVWGTLDADTMMRVRVVATATGIDTYLAAAQTRALSRELTAVALIGIETDGGLLDPNDTHLFNGTLASCTYLAVRFELEGPDEWPEAVTIPIDPFAALDVVTVGSQPLRLHVPFQTWIETTPTWTRVSSKALDFVLHAGPATTLSFGRGWLGLHVDAAVSPPTASHGLADGYRYITANAARVEALDRARSRAARRVGGRARYLKES